MNDKAITQFKSTLQNDSVQERFEAILKEKSPAFLASLLSLVSQEEALQKCEPSTILTSAAKAAILDLPIEKSLGFAWIVPFGSKAEFIMGYKGYIQLALRTSFYDAINATPVYQGEEVVENRLTGEIKLNGQKISDEVIGYASYFRLKNGFEKFIYMDADAIHAHAKKYSKSYGHNNSAWTTNFDDMAKKTVLRLLLGRYGLLSIEMQDADVKDVPFANAGDNGRLTTTPEDITVPDFEDVIDAEMVDVAEPEAEKISLQTAEKIKSSSGELYGDIDDETLAFMANSLDKSLSKKTLSPKTREEKQLKRDAIEVILASRK